MAKMADEKLKGIIVWEPMMKNDSADTAAEQAGNFSGLDVIHYWDSKKEFGDMLAKMLHLNSTAWDVYLFFSKNIKWDESTMPLPSFWMHQLPGLLGADKNLALNTTRLVEKVCGLLECNNGHKYDDLGFYLHMSALTNLADKGSLHTLEDLSETLKNKEHCDEKI
jgi:hypothetical protein